MIAELEEEVRYISERLSDSNEQESGLDFSGSGDDANKPPERNGKRSRRSPSPPPLPARLKMADEMPMIPIKASPVKTIPSREITPIARSNLFVFKGQVMSLHELLDKLHTSEDEHRPPLFVKTPVNMLEHSLHPNISSTENSVISTQSIVTKHTTYNNQSNQTTSTKRDIHRRHRNCSDDNQNSMSLQEFLEDLDIPYDNKNEGMCSTSQLKR